MSPDCPIGIFDSGVGGLTVFKAIKEILPNENIVYLADTQRMPYGGCERESIVEYTNQAIDFFQKQHVKLIVFACHTVSSVFDGGCAIPIINVIDSGLQAIHSISKKEKIGILGTERTIRSGIYKQKIQSMHPESEVISIASARLASFIETQHSCIEEEVISLLNRIGNVDVLLLACTHYPLVLPLFEKWMQKKTLLIDAAIQTAQEVQEFLKENHLLWGGSSNASFFVTDHPESFSKKAACFLGEAIQTKNVNLIEGNPWQSI